jgi:hypothetical protein
VDSRRSQAAAAGYRNFPSLFALQLRAVVLDAKHSLYISWNLLEMSTKATRQASSFVFPDSARFRRGGLNVDLVAERTWAAGLWDFVWSGGSGFWSIAKHGAEAERVESSAASASMPSGPGL